MQTVLLKIVLRFGVCIMDSTRNFIYRCDTPIPARILKDLADEIAPLLASIFQRSFDCGEVPDDWRSANITPAFKKGDRFKEQVIIDQYP